MPRADGKYAEAQLKKFTGLDNLEAAMQQWNLIDVLPEDHVDFVPSCDLCNAQLHKENCVIQHEPTDAIMKVGSTCVRRFVILRGAYSLAESNDLFDARIREVGLADALRYLMLDLMNDPVDPTVLNRFRREAALFFGVKVGELSEVQQRPEQWRRFLDILNPDGRKKITERARAALFDAKKLVISRKRVRFANPKHELWAKKARLVRTTLASSEAYRNPYKSI